MNWFDSLGLVEDSPSNKAKRDAIAQWALLHDGSTSFTKDKSKYAPGYSYDKKFGPQYPKGSYKCSAFTCAAAAAANADIIFTVRDKNGNAIERCPTAAENAKGKNIPNWRLLNPGEPRKPGDIESGAYPPGTSNDYTGHTAVVVPDGHGGTTTIGAHNSQVGPPGLDSFPGIPSHIRYIGD